MLGEVGRRASALEAAYANLQHEIAERRSAEDALRAADRRKDEFLAMLAHELRNPLAPIRNALRPAASAPAPDRARCSAARDVIDRQLRAHGAAGRRPARRLAHHARQDRAAARARRPGAGRRATPSRPRARSSRRAATQLTVARCRREPLCARRRPDAAGAGVRQPAQQRGEVHRRRAARIALHGRAARRTRSSLSVRGHRHRHPAGDAAGVFDMFTQVDTSLERIARGGLGIGLTLSSSGSSSCTAAASRRRARARARQHVRRAAAARRPKRRPRAAAQGDGRARRRRRPRPPHPGRRRQRRLRREPRRDAARAGHEVRVAHDGASARARRRTFRPDVASSTSGCRS